MDTSVKMSFPRGIFDRLPYRSFYLDFSKNPTIKRKLNLDGCIVVCDTVNEKYNIIRIVLYSEGISKSVRIVVLPNDEEFELSTYDFECKLTGLNDDSFIYDISQIQAGLILKCMIYLCSYEPDIRETIASKNNAKQAKKNNSKQKLTREYSVGERFGEAFRKWTKAQTHNSSNNNSHNHKKPHVRRAHWHRFWVGKKDSSDRKLVIKWVSECFCGTHNSNELDVVKHKVNN